MVTQVLLGEPQEIATRWERICEELKAQIGFLPRLTGLLTETQVNELVDRELKELSRVMHALHAAFNKGDTLEISDSIELRLLPLAAPVARADGKLPATGQDPPSLRTPMDERLRNFYLETRVKNASPGQLLIMLFDALVENGEAAEAELAAPRRARRSANARRSRIGPLPRHHYRAEHCRCGTRSIPICAPRWATSTPFSPGSSRRRWPSPNPERIASDPAPVARVELHGVGPGGENLRRRPSWSRPRPRQPASP